MIPTRNLQHVRGRILVVDDDILFRESISASLAGLGYSAYGAGNGGEAIAHVTQDPEPDLVLLEWNLPDMSGIELLRRLKSDEIGAAVIFLTVLRNQVSEEAGLLGGAVDFVEKSRSFYILRRRIELALVAKRPSANGSVHIRDIRSHDALTLHTQSCRATWNGKALGLTLTEFNIVEHLVRQTGTDVTYRDLYDIVHGEGFMAGNGESGYRTNVRTLIRRIRQKFLDIDPQFSAIANRPGVGYRWKSEAERE